MIKLTFSHASITKDLLFQTETLGVKELQSYVRG